jgi:hypothetical protein
VICNDEYFDHSSRYGIVSYAINRTKVKKSVKQSV